MTARGLISIGTNSTRALVAQFDPSPKVVLERSIGTRIGEGLRESGTLDQSAMTRTLEAVELHTRAVRELTSDLRVIATSALRRAGNSAAFAAKIQAQTGARLEILSGDEEARCSYAGAVSGLPSEERRAVLDVGGGSTEYATADAHVSCEIGAVRLTERFPELGDMCGERDLDRARKAVIEATEPLRRFDPPRELICVGGTATTICALIGGERTADVYRPLRRGELSKIIERLASLTLEERKSLAAMPAQRADIVLAGALIVKQVFEFTGLPVATVSSNDLLLGYLVRH